MSPRYQPQLLSLNEQAELGLNSTSSAWESKSHHHLLSVSSQPQFLLVPPLSAPLPALSIPTPLLYWFPQNWRPEPSISELNPFTHSCQSEVLTIHSLPPTNAPSYRLRPEICVCPPLPGRPVSQAWSTDPPHPSPLQCLDSSFYSFYLQSASGVLSTCLYFWDTL